MPRALSIQEFDYKSLEEKLRHVEAFLDRSVPVRVRSVRAKGKVRSLSELQGKTAILPSLCEATCYWEPDVPRCLPSRIDWMEGNKAHISNSPLDFRISLFVEGGVSIVAGCFWINSGPCWALVIDGPARDFGSYRRLLNIVKQRVATAGVEIENVFSWERRYRLAFPCEFEEFRVLARFLHEGGYEAPAERHWISDVRNGLDVIEGKNPIDVADRVSSVSPDRCTVRHEYAWGVAFDLAIGLGSKLDCPSGWWTYNVLYDDGDEVAECGVDRFETVLFDQPEARTIGVLSTSFGEIQLNRIYADGKYRLELESRYPLEELPKELANWGVEFDMK